MAIQKTQAENIALGISPRNYSAILSTIYDLNDKAVSNYVPEAPNTIVYSNSVIGEGSSHKTFNTLASASFVKGDTITVSGRASYLIYSGYTTIAEKAAIKIVAQIDFGRYSSTYQAYSWEALASEIVSDGANVGQFSFEIPSSITSKLAVADDHYLTIRATSPDNAFVQLTASGTTDNVRKFAIIAS
jgi:hypothetical protein